MAKKDTTKDTGSDKSKAEELADAATSDGDNLAVDHDASGDPSQHGIDHNAAAKDNPARQAVKEQIHDLKHNVGDDEVLGEATLNPASPDPEPEQRVPDAVFDVTPLDPLDSEEAWKEKEKVATGVEDKGQGDIRDGSSFRPTPIPQDPIAAQQMANNAGTIPTSELPDGSIAHGYAPNGVVIEPANAPAPVNPQSDAQTHQQRVMYEEFINKEAEAFVESARIAFIEAKLGGADVELTITGGDAGSDDDTNLSSDIPADRNQDPDFGFAGPDDDRRHDDVDTATI